MDLSLSSILAEFTTSSLILMIIASLFTIATSFMKDMRIILLCLIVASVTTAVNYFVSDSSGGFASYIIATAVALTSGIFAIKKKTVPMFVIIIYCLAFIVANVFAFEAWYTVFAIIGPITGVIGNTRENGMSYRIWILANSILWLLYDIFANAPGPFVQHLIFTGVFAIGLSLDIRKLTKEKEKNEHNYSNH